MAYLVHIKAHIKSLLDSSVDGDYDLATLQYINKSDSDSHEESYNNINDNEYCPPLNQFNPGSRLFWIYADSITTLLPPDGSVVQVPPLTAFGEVSNKIVMDINTTNVDQFEITFPYYSSMSNKKIRLKLSGTALRMAFYEGSNEIFYYNYAPFPKEYTNQFNYYRITGSVFAIPFFFADRSETYGAAAPKFTAFVAYKYRSTYYPEPTAETSAFTNTLHTSSFTNNLYSFFEGAPIDYVDYENPYADGGTSEEGGGNGNFSDNSDVISDEGLPTLSAVGSGFATLFTPSKIQLRNLADIMWNSNIFTALQNLVENITNMFTGLSIVPFNVTAGSTVEVTWLGLPITELYLTLAAQQYYDIDMGAINLANDDRIFTSGSALDYSPFSKLGIYLPFIGFQELDIDECRGTVMHLHYKVDILSGTCVAMIALDGNEIYQYTGNCLTQIPITNESLESLISDAVQVGIAISNTNAATGAVSAAESEWGAANTEGEIKTANTHLSQAHSNLATSRGHLASATANAAMGIKPNIKKSGAVSAAASLLSIRQPYLFLTTPRQSLPAELQKFEGFPSNITDKLGNFEGFTVVESIRLNDLVATTPEVAEIYDLLKKGVII